LQIAGLTTVRQFLEAYKSRKFGNSNSSSGNATILLSIIDKLSKLDALLTCDDKTLIKFSPH